MHAMFYIALALPPIIFHVKCDDNSAPSTVVMCSFTNKDGKVYEVLVRGPRKYAGRIMLYSTVQQGRACIPFVSSKNSRLFTKVERLSNKLRNGCEWSSIFDNLDMLAVTRRVYVRVSDVV